MKKHRVSAPDGMLVIKTARRLEDINLAAKQGLWPIVKKLNPLKSLFLDYFVLQNKDTGSVGMHHNVYRHTFVGNLKKVIEHSSYYPYSFPSPFAAYLVPKALEIGTMVWLDDVIEDLVEGYDENCLAFRVESIRAEWTGDDFTLQYIPPYEPRFRVG
jgi:hypothetical protein